jgi:hypothetical protein
VKAASRSASARGKTTSRKGKARRSAKKKR